MEHITVKEIIEATGGTLICGSDQVKLSHISIQSGTMKGNDLFVPLIGEKTDAHRFIDQALECGAAAVLTSEHNSMDSDIPFIRVRDTKKALQDIGFYYRRRLSIPLVGVTGSVGKTTTREMIAAALSAGYQVYKTPANHNSQVGVPLTLSELSEKDQIGVIELGMSEPGELTVIAKIAGISMAVITNIGITHIEQLGSQENIFREKMSIQDGLMEGGTLILNGDDPLLEHTAGRPGFKTIYYGTDENCHYRAVDLTQVDGLPVFTAVCGLKKVRVHLNVMGQHNVQNAMAALAVACENGLSLESAAVSLESFHGFKGRQQILRAGGFTIIDDTYNASPVSMCAALEVLLSMKTEGRRIAVLADMKELGPDSPRFHYEIGTYLSEHPADLIFTLGEDIKEVARSLNDHGCHPLLQHYEEMPSLIQSLKETVKTGDCILFKGSNSMKLGEAVSAFLQNNN